MKFEIVIDDFDNDEMNRLDELGKLSLCAVLATREIRRMDSWIKIGHMSLEL